MGQIGKGEGSVDEGRDRLLQGVYIEEVVDEDMEERMVDIDKNGRQSRLKDRDGKRNE